MNERLTHTVPTADRFPSAAEQLMLHLSSSHEVSKGVVQIKLDDTHIDSSVYVPKMVGKELEFETSSPDGTGRIIRVRSIEGSCKNFVVLDEFREPTEVILNMSFADFNPQSPSQERVSDSVNYGGVY